MPCRNISLYVSFLLFSILVVQVHSSDEDLNSNLSPRIPKHGGLLAIEDSTQTLAETGHIICHAEPARSFRPAKKNIWQGLTVQEAADVKSWLRDQKDLNTEPKSGGYAISSVEWMPPNKTEALRYLDHNGPEPLRFAQVQLQNHTGILASVQRIIVGPLPVREGVTTWSRLAYPYTKKSDGAIRSLYKIEFSIYGKRAFAMGKSVEDITLDLWNATAAGYHNDSLYITANEPIFQDNGIWAWFGFYNDRERSQFDTGTLAPLGLFFGYNMTGDPSTWYSLGWMYDGKHFKTAQELRKAYFSGKLPKLPAVKQGVWGGTDRRGPRLPLDRHAPPTNIAPSGSRFFVDNDNKVVKWMDFEFNMAYDIDTGIRLYDVKYKGKRILYELGLQEALAHYAANDPVQSGTAFLDTYYGFGSSSVTLIDGYDCPSYSTYLNISSKRDAKLRFPNNLCLFEMDAGYPLARHTSYKYEAITKNIFFTVRGVYTVGNYDYLLSYEFYLDGTMRIDMRASGYIETTYQAANHEYGYQIRPGLSGSMHDHVINFKADFDILGTKNSLETVEFVPHSEVYPWSAGNIRHTMKLKRGFIKSEDESKLYWGHNSATHYKIVNRDAINQYGEAPGYRIFPSSGAVHLAMKRSSNLGRSIGWAFHDLFVTKAKDTEPRSADPLNTQDTYDPLIDFDKFFDGENLEQEDLVLWFNLGMHHLPHTGDLPNTMFTTAHSGVTLMPVNYLDGDPSVQSAGRVRVNFGKPYTPKNIVDFGQEAGWCRMNVTGDDEMPY